MIEILDEILGGFNSDGKPDQAIGNPEALPVCGRKAGVRRGCGSGNERFNASQTRGADRQSRPLDEALGFVNCALQFKTHDAAEAVEQLPRAVVSALALESGVVHLLDRRVSFQESGYRERALILILDPDGKSF